MTSEFFTFGLAFGLTHIPRRKVAPKKENPLSKCVMPVLSSFKDNFRVRIRCPESRKALSAFGLLLQRTTKSSAYRTSFRPPLFNSSSNESKKRFARGGEMGLTLWQPTSHCPEPGSVIDPSPDP